MLTRSSGILLHISSLPSPYGIGTMGAAAYRFIDFLKQAGQTYWQILPIGPTGYGDSPYQSFSTFAGNPYLIDLEALIACGWLKKADAEAVCWSENPEAVSFQTLYRERKRVLRLAFETFRRDVPEDYAAFLRENADWLDEYALFMALKSAFSEKPWVEWPEEARLRRPEALRAYREELREEMDYHRFVQYVFDTQWAKLLAYAHENGIRIIGDIPIYVPLDSADVWANPKGFLMDRKRRPTLVAGCPPDGFSEDGQFWGNPIYDWAQMERDGFSWWLRRVGAAGKRFDVTRIDHFRGFESYWAIPAGDSTARNGSWKKGPGRKLIDAIRAAYPEQDFIAEDLGFLTEEVHQLVKDSGWPGMKVLEFAFDPREPSEYLPHTYQGFCVCYTGTHDNETLCQWCEGQSEEVLTYAREYLGISESDDLPDTLIRVGMASKATLFIAQMQDYLRLGAKARMNHPGLLLPENWRWRMLPGAADGKLAKELSERTAEADRLPAEA